MYQSRKGAALIIALAVVLIAGTIIGLTFDMVYSYVFITLAQRSGYVDHTTLLSATQEMKGRIISENEAAGETKHAPALGYATKTNPVSTTPANGSLTVDNLRFADANWKVVRKSVSDSVSAGGVGDQYVDVDVYDMYYMLDWVKADELSSRDFFPPTFRMEGGAQSTGGGSDGGNVEGDVTSSTSGSHSTAYTGNLLPYRYGAYLVRAKLYNGKNSEDPVRVAEEAFVQVLPDTTP